MDKILSHEKQAAEKLVEGMLPAASGVPHLGDNVDRHA
ncbi:MAG: YjfB family protein [Bacillota bacterium]